MDIGDKMKRIIKEFISLVKIIIISYLVIAILSSFVIRPVQVKGTSMDPTLHDKDLGFSYIITKKLFGLSRGTIITVHLKEESQYIVKRVVALPGETVYAENGIVYVNDIPLEEDYLDQEFMDEYELLFDRPFTQDFPKIKVPEGQYFALGDNRPNSKDSRHYGPFKDEDIETNSLFIIYPFKNFGIK